MRQASVPVNESIRTARWLIELSSNCPLAAAAGCSSDIIHCGRCAQDLNSWLRGSGARRSYAAWFVISEKCRFLPDTEAANDERETRAVVWNAIIAGGEDVIPTRTAAAIRSLSAALGALSKWLPPPLKAPVTPFFCSDPHPEMAERPVAWLFTSPLQQLQVRALWSARGPRKSARLERRRRPANSPL